MKILNKSLAIAAAVAVAAVVVPEAAMAKSKSKVKHTTTTKQYSSSSSSISSSYERRLAAMEEEIAALRAELNQAKSVAPAKVQEIEQKQQQLEQQIVEAQEHEQKHHNLLFFRGGYAKMSHARNNELLINNDVTYSLDLSGTQQPKDGEGWYTGAGFDYHLTDDLWGLTDLAAVDGEVMFQYMNFGSSHNTAVDIVLSPVGTTALTGGNAGNTNSANAGSTGNLPGVVNIKNQITQFTLSASPKIKFNLLDGSLRPWIIPFGLSINVISPPSSGVTVLNPGLMVGTGIEYQIWKSLWAGIDFRYNFTGNDLNYKYKLPNGVTLLNETNIDGFTTGAYLGFGF